MTATEQINNFIAENGGNVRDALNVALTRLQLAENKLAQEAPQPDLNDFLNRINNIMWNSYMVKDEGLKPEHGDQIMQVLNEWASNDEETKEVIQILKNQNPTT